MNSQKKTRKESKREKQESKKYGEMYIGREMVKMDHAAS